MFAGDDRDGVPLEVIVVERIEPDRFSVIHAMKLRKKFEWLYEELS